MTPDELFALRKRYLELADQATAITDEQTEIKRRIRQDLPAGSKLPAGDGQIHVQPNRRFDTDKGAALLPTDEIRAMCRLDGYDDKKIRKMLPPTIQEMCMVEIGEPKVVIT